MVKLCLCVAIIFLTAKARSQTDPSGCALEVLEKENPQYIFLGENHFDNNPLLFFYNILPKLKSMGFRTIFVEYFESYDQNHIDRLSAQNLVDRFSDPQLQILDLLINDWGYDSSKYYAISFLALQSGLKLRGIDRRRDLVYMTDFREKMAVRDQHMFLISSQYITMFPEEKIIFFNGYSHSRRALPGYGPTLFDHFMEHYGNKKIMSLKHDYLYDLSQQRMDLRIIHGENLKMNCSEDFYFYKDPQSEQFNYHIFLDPQELLPLSDQYNTTSI